ncbi:hypothetical protein PR048_015800 [Dryococelus australis]|uniref:Uncharacterized protein n=1 Tax=Dryococelus australis TaxID=614101 RepID=A0ABQ9HI93_9NEOP|nr:hypothetical protein PR048_015800 [Dryococelus australis]
MRILVAWKWVKHTLNRRGQIFLFCACPHRSCGGVVVILLAPHHGEPGSISAGSLPGFSHVGIVPDDAASWRDFSGISRSPTLAFLRRSIPTSCHPYRLSRPRCYEPPISLLSTSLRHTNRRNNCANHVFKQVTFTVHTPANIAAGVVKWLDYSFPTKANRVRFSAGSPPDFRMCWTMPLVGGFSRGSPTPPAPINSDAAPYSPQSSTSALKTSLLRAAQISVRVSPGHGAAPVLRSSTPGATNPLAPGGLCVLRTRRYARVTGGDDIAPIPRLETISEPTATVAERLARSPPTKANWVQSPSESPDFRKWESCRMMPLVGEFSQGSPVFPAPSFRCRSIFTSITLIGSQDLAVKSHPNLFTHSN